MAADPQASDSKLSVIEEDADVAPAHVITQLLVSLREAIMAEDFEKALILCKKVLRFEPGNSLAARYLTLCKKHVDGESDSDDGGSSSSGKSADSSDEDASSDESDEDAPPAQRGGARESKHAGPVAAASKPRPGVRHK